ncbi:uncharacterized protein LOC130113129 [Lampris incognitus]|uniref:uncharacterized protein LOC130113129 n=1 Tax=Lampris incognitus TaxID=2546036 RepID=UPI0024B4E843|nr:uncharacterized protein LOC130113129 [Lampris incognitus]
MGFGTGITMLLLTTTFVSTTQELVWLNVSSEVTAACGQTVTLNCKVSSSREGLTVTHLRWNLNRKRLCEVDILGEVTQFRNHTQSEFQCAYTQRHLSLTFQQVQPMESVEALYMCKLHSNHGITEAKTTVELKECYRDVDVDANPKVATCRFTGVHPDGDVHWFHGSTRLTGANTSKSVEAGGWMTIVSSLEKDGNKEPYSCSLWNPASGQYLTDKPVGIPEVNMEQNSRVYSAADAQQFPWTFLGFLLIATFLMK